MFKHGNVSTYKVKISRVEDFFYPIRNDKIDFAGTKNQQFVFFTYSYVVFSNCLKNVVNVSKNDYL